ncbi:acyltransferase family protein [Nocardia altamirensis]|uniref:acyltransferase family protein n=1 Tax=Nocardia altamirensis TaxID=472158 RepID=UPI0008401BB9|nr:acyltransferase family protein [Nocardia altamirensis]
MHGAGRSRTAAARTEFRPDIEGLRAVAVIAVVLFHAGVPGIGGGFAGVDVFFVISGFLITGMLWRELSRTGTIRLARFYGGRARRLLPVAGIVLIATAFASARYLPPLQAREVLGDGIASALYVGNYRLAMHGTDYLAAAAPSPFQHYWSLGVEEQFYLLWPALLIGAAWLVRLDLGHDRRARRSAMRLRVLLAVLSAGSLGVAIIWTTTQPPWAFFALPARAWELGIGGLIALSAVALRRLAPTVGSGIGWLGLAMIVLAYVVFDNHTPYPGTAALLPVLGTALVIASGCAAPASGVGLVLAWQPLRAIGRVSYSWYLWHWPVLLLAPHIVGHSFGLVDSLGALAVSGGLAMLTMQLVENPVRFAKVLRRSANLSLACGGLVTAAAVCAAAVLLVVVHVPVGSGAAAEALSITNTPPPQAVPLADPYDAAVQHLTAQVQAAVAASAELRAVPSNLTPSLADAPGDKASVFLNGCVRSWREAGQGECAAGDLGSATRVALVGDSHAAMWSPAFEQIAEQQHWRLETMSKVTCPLMALPITSPYLGREYTECVQWRGQVLARLQAEHPKLIVLSMSRRYGGDFGFTTYDSAWVDSLAQLVTQLRATGTNVLVLGPVPDPLTTAPTCLSDHVDNATACAPTRAAAVNDAGIAAETAATTTAGGQYANLTELFCTSARCPLITRNTLIFRDDNHVTVTYARALAPIMAVLAERTLAKG